MNAGDNEFMPGLWARLQSMMESGMRQQFTKAGVVYMTALILIAVSAFASANNLLFLILAAMLSTAMVSGFISRLSLSGLELEFSHPEHISARRRTPGNVALRNLKWIPSFSIRLTGGERSGIVSELYFPSVPGRSVLEEHVDLFFPARGVYQENDFHLSTRFPFGFTERRATVPLRQEILVYPCIDPAPDFDRMLAELSGDVNSHFRGRGHDFYRIRPYVAFESARHVDWRATAHTGDLQVREFAREQEQAVVVLLDVEPETEGAQFEHMVDCCACVVWRFSQHAGKVHFHSQGFFLRTPEDGDVYAILKFLATVRAVRGRTPPTLHDAGGFQVIFSSTPSRLSSYGWATEDSSSARVWRPADLLPAGAGASTAALS
jgi:uncharacterized protein (DUF58 family)